LKEIAVNNSYCRRSSVVEHTLGKGGVGSSILLGGTIYQG
jgi:hypothetical protein